MQYRIRKLAIAMTAAAMLVAVALIICWPKACPFDLELVGLESSHILDDHGEEFWLATVRVHNLDGGWLAFEKGKVTSEARIEGAWVEVTNFWNLYLLGDANSGQLNSREVLLLLPAQAQACKLNLNFQGWPLKWRLRARLQSWSAGKALLAKVPKLDRFFATKPATGVRLALWRPGAMGQVQQGIRIASPAA